MLYHQCSLSNDRLCGSHFVRLNEKEARPLLSHDFHQWLDFAHNFVWGLFLIIMSLHFLMCGSILVTKSLKSSGAILTNPLNPKTDHPSEDHLQRNCLSCEDVTTPDLCLRDGRSAYLICNSLPYWLCRAMLPDLFIFLISSTLNWASGTLLSGTANRLSLRPLWLAHWLF